MQILFLGQEHQEFLEEVQEIVHVSGHVEGHAVRHVPNPVWVKGFRQHQDHTGSAQRRVIPRIAIFGRTLHESAEHLQRVVTNTRIRVMSEDHLVKRLPGVQRRKEVGGLIGILVDRRDYGRRLWTSLLFLRHTDLQTLSGMWGVGSRIAW